VAKAEATGDGACGFPHPDPPRKRERERSGASGDMMRTSETWGWCHVPGGRTPAPGSQ